MTEHKGENIANRRDDARSLDVKAQHLHGRVLTWREKITVDAAQDDTIDLGVIPSHAVLSTVVSEFRHEAFGAGVTADIGFADNDRAGVSGQTAALAADLDVAAAGVKKLTAALGISDLDKEAWELAGATEDKKIPLKVIATLKGGIPSSGSIAIEQNYVTG